MQMFYGRSIRDSELRKLVGQTENCGMVDGEKKVRQIVEENPKRSVY